MRIFLTVIDSFGIGEMPDSNLFNDCGSNTYGHVVEKTGVDLKNMKNLGLNDIDGISLPVPDVKYGSYARLKEKSMAKDTTAGHFEMAGIPLEKPYPVFPNGFPREIMEEIERKTGYKYLGNEVASGTEIINRLGKKHLETGMPIIYTSQDSVLQVAAHINVIDLTELYRICSIIRSTMSGEYAVGRIIARPFDNDGDNFYRTPDRKDFSLTPPKGSMMDKLSENHFDVIAVGKIEDLFQSSGITESYHTKNNDDGLKKIIELSKKQFNGLCFANLVDTDMLYGHRNDFNGYAEALKKIDDNIPEICGNLLNDDVLLITADHGCDPTTESTDHSREYVPLLIYGKKLKSGVNLGTLEGFDIISKSILDKFKIENNSESFFRKL